MNENIDTKFEGSSLFQFDLEKIDGIDLFGFISSIKEFFTEENVLINEKTRLGSSEVINEFKKSIQVLTQSLFDIGNDIIEKKISFQLYEQDIEENKKLLKNVEFVMGILISELKSLREVYELENNFVQSRVGSYLKTIPGNNFVSNGDILTKCLERNRFVALEFLKIELKNIITYLDEVKSFSISTYYNLNDKKR